MKSLFVPKIEIEKFDFEHIHKELADKGAKATIDTVNWNEYPYTPTVVFYIAHDGNTIWIRFDVNENNIKAVAMENNGAVCRDSCVEFFVKRLDESHYVNFETNCIATALAARRTGRADAVRFTDEQISRIIRFSTLPHQQINNTNGGEWSIVQGIPFELMNCDKVPDALMANFYKCGDETAQPHFLSWNPIDFPHPDFHRPEFFGKLIFSET